MFSLFYSNELFWNFIFASDTTSVLGVLKDLPSLKRDNDNIKVMIFVFNISSMLWPCENDQLCCYIKLFWNILFAFETTLALVILKELTSLRKKIICDDNDDDS